MAEFLEENERVLGKSLAIFQCDGRQDMSAYVRLKKEMGERLGVIVHVVFASDKEELERMIVEANKDEMIDGILVQLPIMGVDRGEVEKILEKIRPSKDIDGLNSKSSFTPAVVRAVEKVIEVFRVEEDQKIALVGCKGMVGKRVAQKLKELDLEFVGFDRGDDLQKLKDFEVIITATGVAGLITEEMVSEKFVGIDLGYPLPEFSEGAVSKALLITPVPGGVGPMTVVSLFDNLAEI